MLSVVGVSKFCYLNRLILSFIPPSLAGFLILKFMLLLVSRRKGTLKSARDKIFCHQKCKKRTKT